MHDRFKKRTRKAGVDDRLRRKIATEAARRLAERLMPRDDSGHLREASAEEYFAAKRMAAAVLGHAVRPSDLPSDSEVRWEVLALMKSGHEPSDFEGETGQELSPEPLASLAEHVDRFAIYKMRLEPLEQVKQDQRWHPEGDALYHSLQVFELAKGVRPYDEEFLLAALLHDVGKAIDPRNRAEAAVAALRGTLTERAEWLVAHHGESRTRPGRSLSSRVRRELEQSDHLEDLRLLEELDDAGRVPGAMVGTIDEALNYLRSLEDESYLDSPTP